MSQDSATDDRRETDPCGPPLHLDVNQQDIGAELPPNSGERLSLVYCCWDLRTDAPAYDQPRNVHGGVWALACYDNEVQAGRSQDALRARGLRVEIRPCFLVPARAPIPSLDVDELEATLAR